MCGIFGFIGNSKHPKATYKLMTLLAVATEIRGKYATGFWGVAHHANDRIIYHKEPIPSSTFVKGEMWKSVFDFNPNILIGHCRQPSPEAKGVDAASPKHNRNNHPHVSDDFNLAIVHNGRVENYDRLAAGKYSGKTVSKCDSELILQMFQIGMPYLDDRAYLSKKLSWCEKDPELACRLLGVREAFVKNHNGAMAVAVGERFADGKRDLWLFRDEHRTISCINLLESMGIYAFCSTPEIFKEAVDGDPWLSTLIPSNKKIVKMPAYYAYRWRLEVDQTIDLRMFQVNRGMVSSESPIDPNEIEIKEMPPKATFAAVSVITGLDENEAVIANAASQEVEVIVTKEESVPKKNKKKGGGKKHGRNRDVRLVTEGDVNLRAYGEDYDEYDEGVDYDEPDEMDEAVLRHMKDELAAIITEIRELSGQIETLIMNKDAEGLMTLSVIENNIVELRQIKDHLIDVHFDLDQGT